MIKAGVINRNLLNFAFYREISGIFFCLKQNIVRYFSVFSLVVFGLIMYNIFVSRETASPNYTLTKRRRICKMKNRIFLILAGIAAIVVLFYALVLVTAWL